MPWVPEVRDNPSDTHGMCYTPQTSATVAQHVTIRPATKIVIGIMLLDISFMLQCCTKNRSSSATLFHHGD